VLSVTRQGFWAWKRRPPSVRRQADELLKPRILEACKESDQTYWAPRLCPAPLYLVHPECGGRCI
jgi:hypothetical protein